MSAASIAQMASPSERELALGQPWEDFELHVCKIVGNCAGEGEICHKDERCRFREASFVVADLDRISRCGT